MWQICLLKTGITGWPGAQRADTGRTQAEMVWRGLLEENNGRILSWVRHTTYIYTQTGAKRVCVRVRMQKAKTTQASQQTTIKGQSMIILL